MNLADESQSRHRATLRAFLGVAIPYGLAALPLLFHRSDNPWRLGYSAKYAAFLAFVGCGILVLALLAARSTRRRGNYNLATGLVLLLVTILAIAGGAEWILRVRYTRFMDPFWGQRPSLFLGWENQPYHTWSNKYGVFQTDQDGFRLHRSDPDWRAKNHCRIFALGESSTFGLGLSEENTWPALLEKKLREAWGTDAVDVINAGNPGHNSLQIYLQFFFKVWRWRPNVVILYLGKNDAVMPSVHSPTRLEQDPWKLMSYSKLDYVCRMNEGKSWYFRTLLSDFLRERLAQWRARLAREDSPEPCLDETAEDVPEFVRRNGQDFLMKHVGAIADGCRRLNATLVLVTFAHVLAGWDGRAVDYYNQLLRDFAAREGWPLVDFARLVAQQLDPASFFWDDHHPNEKGAALLADALFETLCALDGVCSEDNTFSASPL